MRPDFFATLKAKKIRPGWPGYIRGMPTFCQRPLTWLFWIATVCILIAGCVKDSNSTWFNIILWAQLYVISGWAAVTQAHRLTRGSVLILAPLAPALVTYATQRTPDETAFVLSYDLMLVGLVFVATRALVYVVRAIGPSKRPDGRPWQISVVEMFGWTIVVAIGSWAVSMSKLPEIEQVGWIWETLASIIPASIMMALFLAPRPRHDRASLLISIAGVMAFYAAANVLGNLNNNDHWVFTGMFGYVALWIMVVRLDEHAAMMIETSNGNHSGSSIAGATEDC
jgi:hypothetical protein